jgi:hypothetical protein
MKAVRNLSDWQGVLAHMMTVTGAKAAMITLRDAKTCQIVDDVALETTFHSPLICGFTIESAAYYLQELRTIDPWADAQRLHYPFRPTLMSTVCGPASMPDNKFFKWLADLGCRETVVIELNRMSGYWTALNLFFEEPQSDEAETAKRYLALHSDILKEAWITSQEFIHSKQSQQISLEQVGAPACVVNQNFEVLAHNRNFGHLASIGAVALFGPSKRLSVEHSVVFAGSSDLSSGIRRHDSDATDYRAFMASFDPDPLHKGKREGHQLIVFKSPSSRDNSQKFPEHELENLTAQEKKMFAAVQGGLSVLRAGDQIGVRRSRAFEIWASVKSKLAISNSHQVRTG